MAESGDRDMLVWVQSIDTTAGDNSTALLADPIEMFVDSTEAYIWLPEAACNSFASAFGLTRAEISGRYLLNASTHEQNVKTNASVTFQLANQADGGDSVSVVFPYAAFNLNYTDETDDPTDNYMFPIQLQNNAQGYTLGRAFLQEVYLSANYEYMNFSLYQAIPQPANHDAHIVPLASMNSINASSTGSGPSGNSSGTSSNRGSSGSGISGGAIAGIVIAVLAIAIGVGIFLFCCRRRRNRQNGNQPTGGHVQATYDGTSPMGYMPGAEHAHGRQAMVQHPADDYFARDLKQGTTALDQKPSGAVSGQTSPHQELESNYGQSSGMSSPTGAFSAYHESIHRAQELESAAVVPLLPELPGHKSSVHGSPRTSEALAALGLPQSGPVTRDVHSWGDGTHLEEASIASGSRSNVMSANAMTIHAPGSASIVSHSARSPSRLTSTRSISSDGGLSPISHAAPSMNEYIVQATSAATTAEPLSHSHPLVAAPHANGRGRSASQDTLVGSQGESGGRPSPAAVRRVAEQDRDEPSSPQDDFVHNSPYHGSIGYTGAAWESPANQQYGR